MKFLRMFAIFGCLSTGCLVGGSDSSKDNNEMDEDLVQILDEWEPGQGGSGPESCPVDRQNVFNYEVDVPSACVYHFWSDPSDPPPETEILKSEKVITPKF